MPVQKQEVKYTTSDGREFTDEAEANNHEAVLDALEANRIARRDLQQMLFAKLKTADNELINDGWHTFYYVDDHYGLSEPQIYQHQAQVWPDLSLAENREDVEIEFVSWIGGRNGDRRVDRIKIKNLYYHQKNAELRYVAELRTYITGLLEKISKIEEKYKPK